MKLFKKTNSPVHSENHNLPLETRRSFLQKLGFGGMLAGLVGFGWQSFRSLIPNVLYEPPQKFKIGLPANLAEGMTFLQDKRLYIFKEGKSFYAISAACTHLGCTVKYTKLNQPKQVEIGGEKKTIPFEFHCPCHGSKFYAEGTNYAGPAPRPLHWYKLEVAPDDGQLVVDMGKEVEQNFRLTV
ncbi:MAG: ubiquinol-cytochrome c reductase iron-sulfur subunit [candidate division KSB1 bacterium]|nr:ubiquinol-cytochrome c reductase iron-sulfur subunit [candidate division KSB1 bacterium]MDZ7303084.1 ubiquinol-cytochrome c reductase iron-sulfur subunit [candidate division KSB1 bacterium]MDZ7312623.1 ubiquinol-cytochrome c reductase iron-sulfur subunit [candidate division KSB1 bacterium]